MPICLNVIDFRIRENSLENFLAFSSMIAVSRSSLKQKRWLAIDFLHKEYSANHFQLRNKMDKWTLNISKAVQLARKYFQKCKYQDRRISTRTECFKNEEPEGSANDIKNPIPRYQLGNNYIEFDNEYNSNIDDRGILCYCSKPKTYPAVTNTSSRWTKLQFLTPNITRKTLSPTNEWSLTKL